jgi:tRNA C32,U32 (ribose-2'-O)-methylase TrmJ
MQDNLRVSGLRVCNGNLCNTPEQQEACASQLPLQAAAAAQAVSSNSPNAVAIGVGVGVGVGAVAVAVTLGIVLAMRKRALAEHLHVRSGAHALVFGPERTGMSNDDVYRCHACLSIPAHPDYGSLNLAQAVQLIAYDWRQALGGYDVEPRTADPQLADGAAVHGVLEHWRGLLEQVGFLDPAAPKKLMPRLNQLLNRAQLTQDEVHILRGIARKVGQALPGDPRPAGMNAPGYTDPA